MSDLAPESADPQHPTPRMLFWAYQNGIFPMADPESGKVDWYHPPMRGVIPLDDFHVPASLQRVVHSGVLEVRMDTCFPEVMRACAAPRPGDDLTWISEELVQAYRGLFEMGHAHSVEAWREGQLVGGLYGIHIGAAFFGESMFSRPDLGGSNSSKVCLVRLVEHLRTRGFVLLDTQYWNPHLDQFGCIEIPVKEYTARLATAIGLPVTWRD